MKKKQCGTSRRAAEGDAAQEEKITLRVLRQSLPAQQMPSEEQVSHAIQDFSLNHAGEWQCIIFMSHNGEQGLDMSVKYLYSLDDVESARTLAKVWPRVFEKICMVMNVMSDEESLPWEEECEVAESEPEYQSDEDQQLVDELMPMFYGNEDCVRDFVRRARLCVKSLAVAKLAEEFLNDKKIRPEMVRRPMYRVMLQYGLYDRSESTWNRSIVERKNRK